MNIERIINNTAIGLMKKWSVKLTHSDQAEIAGVMSELKRANLTITGIECYLDIETEVVLFELTCSVPDSAEVRNFSLNFNLK